MEVIVMPEHDTGKTLWQPRDRSSRVWQAICIREQP
jgi:hypothetical protein